MKITHHQLMEGANLSFHECFKMEYRMSQASMVHAVSTCIHLLSITLAMP